MDYETRKSNAAFIKALQYSLSWAKSINFLAQRDTYLPKVHPNIEPAAEQSAKSQGLWRNHQTIICLRESSLQDALEDVSYTGVGSLAFQTIDHGLQVREKFSIEIRSWKPTINWYSDGMKITLKLQFCLTPLLDLMTVEMLFY